MTQFNTIGLSEFGVPRKFLTNLPDLAGNTELRTPNFPPFFWFVRNGHLGVCVVSLVFGIVDHEY